MSRQVQPSIGPKRSSIASASGAQAFDCTCLRLHMQPFDLAGARLDRIMARKLVVHDFPLGGGNDDSKIASSSEIAPISHEVKASRPRPLPRGPARMVGRPPQMPLQPRPPPR
jgi:hypothetical protein